MKSVPRYLSLASSLLALSTTWANASVINSNMLWAPKSGQLSSSCNGDGICNGEESSATCPSECAFDVNYPQPAVSVPVQDHPRIWLNSSDLPRLQSWAVASNPMYSQGLAQAANVAASKYDFMFDSAGNPLPAWWDPASGQDIGINGGYYATETLAALLAFHAMVGPISQAETHAKMARNILMHIVNSASQCIDNPNLYQRLSTGNYPPFCDPNWMSGVANRLAVGGGDTIGLIVDWLKGYEQNRKKDDGSPVDPVLSPADKDTLVKVFSKWADDSVHMIQQEHPWPIDLLNNPELLKGTNGYHWPNQARMTANNYYIGRFRLLTFMTLAIDGDDSASHDSSGFVQTYTNNLLGAWLYQVYAMFEDADKVKQALLSPGTDTKGMGIGLANGGLPVEGTMYGESLGYLFQTLLALHTAGYDGKNLAGPQGGLLTSSYWDQVVTGYLNELAPSYDSINHNWPIASYGDLYSNFLTSYDNLPFFAPLGLYDQSMIRHGDSGNAARDDRLNAVKWVLLNALERSDTANNIYNIAANAAGQMTTTGKGNSPLAREAIFLFMLFDPNEYPNNAVAQKPTDPRPSLATTFMAKPIGRLLSRTDWSTNASWFTHLCEWASISHQYGACGEFELWRNGEWLTKERSGYDSSGTPGYGMTCEYHNCLGIKNKATSPTDANGVPVNLGWYEKPIWDVGGQWTVAGSVGDPSTLASLGEDYNYVRDDATNLYNRLPNGQTSITATEVSQAIRHILWLKPDHIVVYDRATTKSDGLFKHFNMVLEQGVDPVTRALLPPPSVSSNPAKVPALITETTTNGQKLYINALMPTGADVKLDLVLDWGFKTLASPEPSQMGAPNPAIDSHANTPSGYRLQIEEPTAKDVRFLNVLQGADGDQNPDNVTLLHSTIDSSSEFDGVLIQGDPASVGTTYAFFPANQGVVEGLKSQLTVIPEQVYVAGLTPKGNYIAGIDSDNLLMVWPAAVGTQGALMADDGGVLVISPGNMAMADSSLVPEAIGISADGGIGSFIFSTLDNTQSWQATTTASWVSLVQPNGTGGGKIQFKVDPNPANTARTTTINVMGKSFTVSQQPMVCQNKISPTIPGNYTAAGSSGTINVGGNSLGCTWGASSTVPWILMSANAGTGSSSVNYTVTANSGAARTGSLSVAGQDFTVMQAGASTTPVVTPPQNCTYVFTVNSKQITANGTMSGTTFKVPNGCDISAKSSDTSWLTVNTSMVKDTLGTYMGSLMFTAAANNSTQSRTGTITVAGKYPYTVTQMGQGNSCVYNINPNLQDAPPTGGSYTFKLASGTPSNCSWSAATQDSWIGLQGTISGSGSGGVVSYTVAPNGSGSQRTGTISLGGQMLSITQGTTVSGSGSSTDHFPPGNCSIKLSTQKKSVGAEESLFPVQVNPDESCQWTAESHSDWVTLSDKRKGDFDQTVQNDEADTLWIHVDRNKRGDNRGTTVTIGDKTLMIRQSGKD